MSRFEWLSFACRYRNSLKELILPQFDFSPDVHLTVVPHVPKPLLPLTIIERVKLVRR